MADPKIKYDIEAAVKGDADADRLAKALREVGEVLEGDLQQGALDAAQALEALGSKQRALSAFGTLKRETQDLSSQLDKAVGSVDRLGAQLQEAAGKTQALSVAERSTSASVTEAQAALQRKREALRAVREETASAQRRSDEYRATVAGLKDGIKAATEEVKAQQAAQRTAAQASTTAQNAEAALRKEYDLAIGSAARLSTELRTKNAALAGAREAMQSVGVSTSNLAQQERNLQGAVQQVRAEVATMVPAYQQAAAASSQSTQVQAANQRTLRDSMASISTQLQRIQQIAAVAVGGGYFAGLLKDVAATADEFRNLEARVKLATGEGPLFTRSFAGVQRVALDTNSALEETGTLFARLTKAAEEGGASAAAAQDRALGLTRTINQAIQIANGSADAAKAAITQLVQGLQSGVLRGDEFNSVMEQAPRLAQALANGLGVTTGALRQMAEQGALTSETVMKALEGQADAVAGEFSKLPPTVGRALQNLSTQWTLYVGQADKGLISSQNAAKVINTLAQNLDVVVSTLTAAGKAWAAIKIAGLVADFARWATTTVTATAAIEANTVAAVANTSAQRANAAAQAEHAAAQAANTAATTANTAARAANAKAWGEVGAFTRAAGAAQDVATASVVRGTAAVAANASSVAQAGVVWRAASGLFGPWGIAVAALTPEILNLSRGLGEQTAKWMGWGKVVEEAEQKLKMADEISKMHAESMRRQAVAYEEAKSRSLDLTKQSAGLIAEFDKLVKAGDSTTEALGKIGKDFDITKVSGIRDMSAALDKLLADAKITATEFQGAWAKALDGQDLAKFEVNARAAFMSAGREAEKLQQQLTTAIQSGASEEVVRGLRLRLEGALSAAGRESERVAQTMDIILRAAVERTGVEFTVLQGRIGDASRSALNDLDVVIGGLDRLKAQGIDAGRALEASFVKAINTADTQAAIDAVKSKVEQLRARLGERVADGLLDQARQKALELGDALDKARPGIQGLREAMVQLGVTSDASLKQTSATAKQAYDAMLASGKASARELGEGFQKAAAAAIEANNGIPPSWVTAQAAVRGYRIDVDAAGKATVVSMKDAQRATEGAGAAARTAAGDYRNLGDQAQYASAQARALAAAGQQLAASFAQRSADVSGSSITKTQGTTNPVDQVPTFNSRAEAEAWKAEWLRQYARDNMATGGGGMLGNYMRDLVMFEYQKELDALAVREAMEAAKKRAEAGNGTTPSTGTGGRPVGGSGGTGTGSSSGGNTGGSGSSAQPVDRIVNIYIGNSVAYGVPTTSTGQQNLEALAREVLRLLEQQKAALGI